MSTYPNDDSFGAKVDNLLDGRDDPTRGPLDRAQNAFESRSTYSGSTGTWSTGEQGVISAVFDSDDEARDAVAALREEGINDAAISLITQRRGTTTTANAEGEVVDEEHSNLLRGILGGGALGAGIGVAALAIPGVGPLVAVGAIAASAVPEALAIGAAAGALLGSANEALKSHGVSDDDVEYYGNAWSRNGGVLVTVTPHGEASAGRIQEILSAHGGHNSARPRMV